VRVRAGLDMVVTAQSSGAPLSALEIACRAAQALAASGATSPALRAGRRPRVLIFMMPLAVRCR
jgi:hypothetical protein